MKIGVKLFHIVIFFLILFAFSQNISASEKDSRQTTDVGITILEGEYPPNPSPVPPSPFIDDNRQAGKLPNTGYSPVHLELLVIGCLLISASVTGFAYYQYIQRYKKKV